MGKKCIGIDVGGTTVKVGMFELDGTLVKKWEVPTRKEENGKYILPDVAASIRKVLNEQNISLNEVAGAGLGIPGPVLPNGFVEVCVNLGWREMNPQEILSGLLDGMTVKTGNDANVAALGEMWQGGGKGYHDIVMVTLGTGVGGGVIIDEKIIPADMAWVERLDICVSARVRRNSATVRDMAVWSRSHPRPALREKRDE